MNATTRERDKTMSIDDLVNNLHATITSGVPAPVSGYTTEEEAELIFMHGDPMTGAMPETIPEPEPEPEAEPEPEPYAGTPRTLNEVAVLAVSKPWREGVEDRRAVMMQHLGDNPRAWAAVLAEAEERDWIDSGALDADLTPAGIQLAVERGWLRMSAVDEDDTHPITSMNAKGAIAWVRENVTEWEHVDEARAAESSRTRPRVSVLAAIDKAEAKISEAEALLDVMQAHEEEARNEAIREHNDEQREQKQEQEQPCTLAEIKAFAQEALKWVDADSESTLDKLCRMVLSVESKPAPKVKAKAVPIKRVEGGTIVRTYKGQEMVVSPMPDGKWNYEARAMMGVSLAAVLREHGITGFSGPEFFGYPTVTWLDGQPQIVLGK